MIEIAIGIFIMLASIGFFTFIYFLIYKTKEQEQFEDILFNVNKEIIENTIEYELPYYFFYRQDVINHILKNGGQS